MRDEEDDRASDCAHDPDPPPVPSQSSNCIQQSSESALHHSLKEAVPRPAPAEIVFLPYSDTKIDLLPYSDTKYVSKHIGHKPMVSMFSPFDQGRLLRSHPELETAARRTHATEILQPHMIRPVEKESVAVVVLNSSTAVKEKETPPPIVVADTHVHQGGNRVHTHPKQLAAPQETSVLKKNTSTFEITQETPVFKNFTGSIFEIKDPPHVPPGRRDDDPVGQQKSTSSFYVDRSPQSGGGADSEWNSSRKVTSGEAERTHVWNRVEPKGHLSGRGARSVDTLSDTSWSSRDDPSESSRSGLHIDLEREKSSASRRAAVEEAGNREEEESSWRESSSRASSLVRPWQDAEVHHRVTDAVLEVRGSNQKEMRGSPRIHVFDSTLNDDASSAAKAPPRPNANTDGMASFRNADDGYSSGRGRSSFRVDKGAHDDVMFIQSGRATSGLLSDIGYFEEKPSSKDMLEISFDRSRKRELSWSASRHHLEHATGIFSMSSRDDDNTGETGHAGIELEINGLEEEAKDSMSSSSDASSQESPNETSGPGLTTAIEVRYVCEDSV